MSTALIQLRDVEKEVLVQDMNYQFQYVRVPDPDNLQTKYFNLFYKENNAPTWNVCPTGLLSDEYTIVKTEDAIKEIQESLNAKIIVQKNMRFYTTVRSNFVLDGFSLNLNKDTIVDKIIFKLITGVDIEDIDSDTALAFSIINGFSGNISITLQYGFMTSYNTKEKNVSLFNPYILDEYSVSLIHDGKLKLQYDNVRDVREQCNKRIETFKSIIPDKELFDNFEHRIPKKTFIKFMTTYNDLANEYQNLYYLTYLVSTVSDGQKKFMTELALRKTITDYFKSKTTPKKQ